MMYGQRQNLDLDAILDKAPTPNRLRPPSTIPINAAPIRKVPMKMVPNKQNMVNQNNQWMGQANNYNYEETNGNTNMGQKGMMMMDNVNKKPLISPVRNPFKTQLDNMNLEEKPVNKFISNNNNNNRPQLVMPNQPKLQQYNINTNNNLNTNANVNMNMNNNGNETQNCVNHPNKPAQFNIDIQDECLAYCGRCAAQLASQGFEVNKIEAPTIKKGGRNANLNFTQQEQTQPRGLPRYPEYEGNPMYELILQFLTQLSQVENQHLQNMTKLTMMDNNYNEQIQNTKNFYTELITFIQQMKDDHINDLYEESRKHSQIADIQHDYLRENVDQIANIRNDIQDNLDTIVEKLDEQDLKNNLNYYRQKLQVYKHKVQEQSQFFEQVISFSPEQYQSKLARIQDFLMEVWKPQNENQQEPQQQKYVQNFMPLQPKQPFQSQPQQKPNDYLLKAPTQIQPPKNVSNPQNSRKPTIQPPPQNENQTAFRRLFEEEPVMAETSPQFKKI